MIILLFNLSYVALFELGYFDTTLRCSEVARKVAMKSWKINDELFLPNGWPRLITLFPAGTNFKDSHYCKFDTAWAGFDSAENLSSGFTE